MEKINYDKSLSKEELKRFGVIVGENVVVGENVSLTHGVCLIGKCEIGDGCEITGNSVVKNSVLGKNVKISSSYVTDSKIENESCVGPFANLRDKSILGENCRVGNFVEIKNSIIGKNTKMAHLTYIGDAEIGDDCNIGCGVVFCNYNGEIKQKSIVGNRVFVGSNVNIIAPVRISDEAYIAAGSTINKDVKRGEFSIARARQENKGDFNNPYLKNKDNKR